ncbi:MAG TPA: 5-oxoprolinase subunit PxpA [Vicinamibacterales bacterium]|nr:5-oxoprolinase subunit PxpA [Vicinamibacterales bacterium]
MAGSISIDINCDMGESFGPWPMGTDALVLPFITSANIACGAHAGDPSVMRRTVRLAREHGVSVGAHPGFPDLQGFGRREMRIPPSEVEDSVLAQIGALDAIARAEGVRLRHVKAHGALYNMAARDRSLADAVARAIRAFDPSLIMLGLPGSALIDAGEAAGLTVAREGFADRSYEPDGSLTPRSREGAVLHAADVVAERAVRLVAEGRAVTSGKTTIALRVDTICVHGDTPGAATLASRVRQALAAAGVDVRPMSKA